MRYIAALDYEHLDNGMFLTALARSIGRQDDTQPIIVHGDSQYTDRIMQTGVMRDDAKIRSIKGLNHRLINLFADEGVSAVGINGYQHELICLKDGELSVNSAFFDGLPAGPVLLISNLVWDEASQSPQPVALPHMLGLLQDELGAERLYAFTKADKDEIIIQKKPDTMKWNDLSADFINQNLPEEFNDFNRPLYLSTARDFGTLPDDTHSIFIK
jgi:hypothetical protein